MSTPDAIRVENLHFKYPPFDPGNPDEDVPYALAGIDLTVAAGEFLGVAGTTASGKSTLCLALNGLVPQQTSGTIRGDVWVGDWSTKQVPVSRLATRVGLVFQDPEANFLGLAVEDEVAFGPENLAVEPTEIEERVGWALKMVGMSSFRDRTIAHLSGGQKQRVAIASALAMLPRILVFDDPTAELDPVGKDEVMAVIGGLRERDITVVMTSSDPEPLARFADRVAVLDAGRLLAVDSPEVVFGDPEPLMQAGVPVPQVSEIAARLNADRGTEYRFSSREQARRVLSEELKRSGPR